MVDIGFGPEKGSVILSRGSGLVWNYQWDPGPDDPPEFPAGSQLDLLIGSDLFPFVIIGDMATVTVQPTDADAVADRTGCVLRFTEAEEPPTNLAVLQVKRVDPRNF